MRNNVVLIGLILLLSTMALQAVEHFSPDRGSFWPSTFPGKEGREIGFVFQNPSGLGTAESKQFSLDTGSPYLGYTPLSASLVLPFQQLVLGVGVLYFSANDAFSVADTVGRPSSQGSLSHQFSQYRVSVGHNQTTHWQWGAAFTLNQETLAGQTGISQSLDLGLSWREPLWWVGVRTQDLFSSSFQWANSSDELSAKIFLQGGVTLWASQVSLEWGGQRVHSEVEVALHPSFSLLGDMSMNDSFGLIRYGYGMILNLQSVQFQYLKIIGVNTDLDVNQDIFAVMLPF